MTRHIDLEAGVLVITEGSTCLANVADIPSMGYQACGQPANGRTIIVGHLANKTSVSPELIPACDEHRDDYGMIVSSLIARLDAGRSRDADLRAVHSRRSIEVHDDYSKTVIAVEHICTGCTPEAVIRRLDQGIYNIGTGTSYPCATLNFLDERPVP